MYLQKALTMRSGTDGGMASAGEVGNPSEELSLPNQLQYRGGQTELMYLQKALIMHFGIAGGMVVLGEVGNH